MPSKRGAGRLATYLNAHPCERSDVRNPVSRPKERHGFMQQLMYLQTRGWRMRPSCPCMHRGRPGCTSAADNDVRSFNLHDGTRSHSAALPTRSPTPKARLLETDAHVVIFSAPICRIVDSVRPHATSWMRSLCTPTHSSGCPRRIVGKHQPAQQINPEPWDPVALVTEPSLSSVFGASSWFSAPP